MHDLPCMWASGLIVIDSDKPTYKDPQRKYHILHIKELIILMNGWHNSGQRNLIFQELYDLFL